MMGHISIELALIFGMINADFSDAAKVAINLGKDWLFKSDWKKTFKPEMVQKTIDFMLHPEKVNMQKYLPR